MIDSKFSADVFAALGPNTPAATELCAALATEIANEVREAIEDTIHRVVNQLRAMGHDLHEWELRQSLRSQGYSFGPSKFPPASGWLGVFFDSFTGAIYESVEPERTTVVQGRSDVEQLRSSDQVPF